MGFHIVADENLQVTPALRAIADSLTLIPGRKIRPQDLTFADVLLVRSVTQVTRELVANTPVRFVGTATAGMEHIDTDALAEMGIGFSAAPGSNATAVVEYVLTALASTNTLPALAQGNICGIVGYGQVGRRLSHALAALGATVQVWDPLADVPGQWRASSLQTVLMAPVVSLHAALHDDEPHASRGLISPKTLPDTHEAPTGQLFVNAGRGGLVTSDALEILIQRDTTLVLDTWPEEPHIAGPLLRKTHLATPHIAGYSFDAKARATDYLVAVLLEIHGGEEGTNDQTLGAKPEPVPDAQANAVAETGEPIEWLRRVLLENYDIYRDDRALRACADPDIAGEDFDALRRAYPLRRELAGQRREVDDPVRYQSMADVVGVKLSRSGDALDPPDALDPLR